MDDERLSKRLSYHLRHAPGEIGLVLSPGSWVEVDALLAGLANAGLQVAREQLDRVVATSPKQRFAFDDDGKRIRANQGHSVKVELQLEPMEPPPILFHGTGERAVAAIRREGLRRMERHHVHLSAERESARVVGARHGRPHVFTVDAARLHRDGAVFYRSLNGVWLVDAVPPDYLS